LAETCYGPLLAVTCYGPLLSFTVFYLAETCYGLLLAVTFYGPLLADASMLAMEVPILLGFLPILMVTCSQGKLLRFR